MNNTMKTNARYEVVAGTRAAPGAILATFPATKTYRCGGPATACLRAFDRMKRAGGGAMFFRRVAA